MVSAPSIPLPKDFDPLPPLLRFKEMEFVVKFWNIGGERWLRDLRSLGILVSVNEFPDGPRARYSSADLLEQFPKRALKRAATDGNQ